MSCVCTSHLWKCTCVQRGKGQRTILWSQFFPPPCRFRGSNSAIVLGLAVGAISLSPLVRIIAGYFMKECVIYKYKYRRLWFSFFIFEIAFLYVALLFWSSLYRPGRLQIYRRSSCLCLLPPLADWLSDFLIWVFFTSYSCLI